jgi:hypothetical protein
MFEQCLEAGLGNNFEWRFALNHEADNRLLERSLESLAPGSK